MRRNTFWLAYCYERWQAASTGWAMALDDEDISQVLSCRMNDFESGVRCVVLLVLLLARTLNPLIRSESPLTGGRGSRLRE